MHTSDNLGLTIVDNGDPADLETVSDDFEVLDALAGDIATVEESPATTAHSVGELLIYEGRLYKVTAAISAGTALTLGTNVRAANIGSEIKTLQDSVSELITTQRYFLTDSNDNKYTVPANSTIVVHTNVALSGYRPLGIVQSSFNEAGITTGMIFSQIESNGDTIMVWRNFTSEAKTSRLQIDVLYVKS